MINRQAAQGLTPTQIRVGRSLLRAVRIRQWNKSAAKLFVKLFNRQNPVVAITGITNAAPPVVSAANHGFANGDLITIEGVVGAVGANGTWEIQNQVTNVSFELKGVAAPGVWTSGGSAYAQPFAILELPAGDSNRDAMSISSDYDGTFGGRDLSAGLSVSVSSSYHRQTAPTGGHEPDVTVDYEQIGA